MLFSQKKSLLPTASEALPGRSEKILIVENHIVTGHAIVPPFPERAEEALFALGCFWGAERFFWQQKGVLSTAVGYAGGITPNPTYQELCTGLTGHTEVVKIIFNPDNISYQDLLGLFWTIHNPTQGMRQGNDTGTQYRSAIYATSENQLHVALRSMQHYQEKLTMAGFGEITTDIF